MPCIWQNTLDIASADNARKILLLITNIFGKFCSFFSAKADLVLFPQLTLEVLADCQSWSKLHP